MIFGSLLASLESPDRPLTDASLTQLFGGVKTDSGVEVTESSSLGFSAVFRAVNLIAGTSASLPLHPYRAQADGVPAREQTGAAARLLRAPHPDLTQFEFWETVYAHLLLWGNAYLLLNRAGGTRVREMWPIHPGRVRAGRASDGQKVYAVDGGTRVWTDAEVLHIPGFGYDGVTGVSPIRLAREGIGLALAAEKFGAKFFASGTLATGILQTDQRLTQDQADMIQERWKARRAGLNAAHDTVILDAGAKFQRLTIPPEEAQFLQTRKFQVTEIARMFGIPPHMLGDTERSTSWGTGIQQQGIGFVVYTLRPWLTRVEQRLTKVIAPDAVYARYSVEGLLRGDTQDRAAWYRAMWELGVYSTDEIRALEERDSVDGGQYRWRPLNFAPLTDVTPDQGTPDFPQEPGSDQPPGKERPR